MTVGLDDNPLTPDGEINILVMTPLDTPVLNRAFEHALTEASDRLALVQLRDVLQEGQNLYRAARSRRKAIAHERREFIPAERFELLERNIRVLGFRMLRVQTKLSMLREARRLEAEEEGRVRSQASGQGEDSLPEMFQSVAAELLSQVTYDQVLEAARARLAQRLRSKEVSP